MQLQHNFNPSSAYQRATQFLIEGLTGDEDETPIWEPIEGSPQECAYHSDADVLGFGGAAGGSKTWLILGFAITKHKRSRIFRRNYIDLQDLIDDGDSILSGITSFVGGDKKRWQFDGRTIMLGYVPFEKDWQKYKGRRVDLMAFDEADQFTESIYENLSGWNGTTDPKQKVRRILCFNPPSAEGEWLISYFGPWIDDRHPNPAKDGELRYYIRNDDDQYEEVNESEVRPLSGFDCKMFYEAQGRSEYYIDNRTYNVIERGDELIEVESRTFFKSLVDDNPYAMATGYGSRLEKMREPLKSQLRYGDFSIGTPDGDDQLIPTEWIIRAQDRHQLMEPPKVKIRATGVDPSRGGKDEFVIANLRANYFDPLICHEGHTIPKIKGGQYGAKLVLAAVGRNTPRIGVDADGIGASVFDSLLEYPTYDVYAINSGSAGYGTDKSETFTFANLRSMMWWMFYEALDPESDYYIALPPDRTLRNELRAPTYSTKTGKIQVEKKEDIKKRINRSTNRADAVIYAWYVANFIKRAGKARVI